jgi:putative colanic acid biosynthesis acetyltransferase WcaF
VYAARILWKITWHTVWKVCWKRLPFLRCTILRCFGAKVPMNAHIAGTAWIEMPWNLTMGEFTAIGPRANVYNLGPLIIGDHTVISHDVELCGGSHDFEDPRYPLQTPTMQLGDYVWVAAGAFILPGRTIADGCVVAARAVVTKDTEPWTIVGGNPAQKIGDRKLKKIDE